MTGREPHLVVAAFWTTLDYDDATAKMAEAMEGSAIEGSGAAVSVKAPDVSLRRWLRAVQLGEAADFHV